MSLSCYCDNNDAEWYFMDPDDTAPYAPLATKRSRKCCSCGERIAVGDLSVRFTRFRYAGWDTIEAKIYGEGGEVSLPSWYMCERCGDLYYSLTELGFCVSLGVDDMRELVREYAGMMERSRQSTIHQRPFQIE